MKQLLSFFCAVLVAITAFGQTSPPNKLRSNDSFTQVDNYLVAAKRLGIPSGATLTLDGSTSSADAPKLFWRTSDSTLHVYVPAIAAWLPAGGGQEGGGTWGTITGTLSDQTDLQNALNSKLDTTAHGFGLSWNSATNKIDWGEYQSSPIPIYQVKNPDGAYIGIGGNPFADTGKGSILVGDNIALLQYTAVDGLSQNLIETGDGTNGYRIRIGGVYNSSQEGLYQSTNGFDFRYYKDYSSSYTNRSLVDKAYVDNQSAFNVEDVTQTLYTDKAINVRAFNNTGMTYSEGSIDFGITRDSTHTMGLYAFKQGIETKASGVASSAFGNLTKASGIASSAFGDLTIASGTASSAFGSKTTASGNYSSAFGNYTTASGNYSSAFGQVTTASGFASSAFGDQTTSSGSYSSAFGLFTIASGSRSSAFGDQTIANEYASIAIGRYSTDGAVETSWTTGSPIFKVGNGTSSGNRSNAYVLYNDGRSEQVKDIEVTEIGQGVVIKSPNGTRWRITVDNSGNLTTTSL